MILKIFVYCKKKLVKEMCDEKHLVIKTLIMKRLDILILHLFWLFVISFSHSLIHKLFDEQIGYHSRRIYRVEEVSQNIFCISSVIECIIIEVSQNIPIYWYSVTLAYTGNLHYNMFKVKDTCFRVHSPTLGLEVYSPTLPLWYVEQILHFLHILLK